MKRSILIKRIILSTLLTVLLIIQLGCNQNTSSPVETGKKPFHFDVKQVKELTLIKNDPSTGDHWLTVLHQTQQGWTIQSSSQEQSLIDTQADDIFILHFLDLIKSIRIEGLAGRGPLSSFGLSPPRFALRWTTDSKSWEFRVGDLSPEKGETYFSLEGETVYVASGPTFKMIQHIQSLQSLRKKTWTLIDADDIDEITILRNRKFKFYAQREGDRWTNRKHQLIRKDIEVLLNKVTTATIKEWIDDPVRSNQLKRRVESSPHFEVLLSDRKRNVNSLKFYLQNRNLFGTNSTRPSSVFLLDQSLVKYIN